MAFSHIPTQEFVYTEQQCVGENNDGGFSPPRDGDAGLVPTLQQNLSNVFALAVGHNHGNDYCCALSASNNDSSSQLHLCFGRHSGYGGYGSWDRGARLYQLEFQGSSNGNQGMQKSNFAWKSWVVMESGDIQDEYNPFQS
eukprot:CAMPEP_0172448024 /NCGR_PEP_ID=MMETSP1065-20121228/7127_1 /TAXON_ID=265537 /ORGANISM="Amphiprora paludosa, Strain CCMP125" /LENGTH=140 /DNA_ID=CAMNT_0013199405 /DNA_START=117 /DNA_END=539 /DNA_ORIENTATION=+